MAIRLSFHRFIPAFLLSAFLCQSLSATAEPTNKIESGDDEKSNDEDDSEGKSKKRSSKKKKRLKKMMLVEDDSSATMREDKKLMVTATLFGVEDGVVQGVDAGYFIRPDIVVAGRYEKNSATLGLFGFTFYKREVNSLGVNGKKFFGNSFYVNGGLIYRTKYVEDITFYTSTDAKECETVSCRSVQEYTEIRPTLAIGNQWQWENFTLGCDWVGLGVSPISQSIKKNEVRKYNVLTDEDLGEISVEPKSIDKGATLRLLAFYLGVSF